MDPFIEKQERREMKKMKKYVEMCGYVADAQFGIPKRCPCGGRIVEEVSLDPKYPIDFDTCPGRRYFTCNEFENDGLHFRQPWVIGLQEEVQQLTRRVHEMAQEIAKLKEAMSRPRDAL